MSRVRTLLDLVTFEHSIFALPFALAALFLATVGRPAPLTTLWIVLAMVGARTLAMTLNRLVDHHIDARNPRTAARPLPRGAVSRGEAWALAGASLVVLLAAVYRLHPVCRFLWPPVVALFFVYPYAKRFTWLSHFVLGLCLGLAPVGAWVAVTGDIASPIWILGLAVTLWTAGFDIIYACQDIEADRACRLHSIPARFGPRAALALSRLLHLLTLALLVLTGFRFDLYYFYYAGVAVAGFLILWEHRLVSPDDFSRLDMAFFTMNGMIAVVFFLFTAADLLAGGLR